MSVGVLASMPLISDAELLQDDDEALLSFTSGSFSKMTNYSWRGMQVTVKELELSYTRQDAEQHGYPDLLTTELTFCCQLFHPHLLQLMAVSSSNDLQKNKLLYERVHVGSLYTLLYHRREEFPVLQVREVLSLILQVCEAVFYLHSRSLVLRSLSSHSVLIVHPGVAKVTGLSFMVPSDCSRSSAPPVPVMLYNWAAPEVIMSKACTGKADLYSICALIQELYTDSVPWGSVSPCWIKHAVDAGQALSADPAVPQPYYDLLLNGLKPRAQERTRSLQDLQYTLRSDLRELSERGKRRSEVRPPLARSSQHRQSTDIRPNRGTDHPDEHYERTQTSISNHISSIVLNLTVSKVLLQQAESSLERTESRMMENACSDVLQFDEPDGSARRRERQVVELKAVGPPSLRYIPPAALQETEEFCSAGEESLKGSEVDKNLSQRVRRRSGGQERSVRFTEECDRSYQSSAPCTSQEPTPNLRTEHNWTSEVSAAVARVAQGFLSCAAGALVGSGDGEEQRPLMKAQEDTQLEQLFKSFAGIHSESEESTDFHTINHTFTLPNAVSEVKGQHREEDASDSDYPQSPVEPSSIFYTPKQNPENTNTEEELSQTLSSEADPDVTMEVCRPDMAVETSCREYRSSPEDLEHAEAEVAPSVHTTSHMTDIADLSSITCSPAQLQEWVGQNGTLPSPRSTRFPPCNSTPRSPHTDTGRGHNTPCREVCTFPLVPHLQSLMETSPWGSAEFPSHPESYNTARLDYTATVHWSVSSVLQSPAESSLPQGDSDMPSSGNPEFTTASTGVRHSEERKRQEHSDTPGKTEAAQELCEEKAGHEGVMKVTERDSAAWCSSDDPPALVLIMARDEVTDNDAEMFTEVEEEESKDLSHAEQNTESYREEILEEQETRRPDPAQRVTALQCDTEKDSPSCDAARALEETERAHSTLDEVLQGLLENPEAERTERGATVITDVSAGSEQEVERTSGQSVSAEPAICEQEEKEKKVMEECSCATGGDTRRGIGSGGRHRCQGEETGRRYCGGTSLHLGLTTQKEYFGAHTPV